MMRDQRTENTGPELRLRTELHARGLRYRLQRRVPGRPRQRIDICFPTERVAVFVDGCFWHSCPEHGVMPRNNRDWWRRKLERNAERDRDVTKLLSAEDWEVIRVWEHAVRDDAAGVAARIEDIVRSRRTHGNPRKPLMHARNRVVPDAVPTHGDLG